VTCHKPEAATKRKYLELIIPGQELGLRDIRLSFSQIGASLDAEKYDQVSALILEFEWRPSIMAVGGFAPEFDYNGQRLQLLVRSSRDGGGACICVDHVRKRARIRCDSLAQWFRARKEASGNASEAKDRAHNDPIGSNPIRVHRKHMYEYSMVGLAS
jgi:hypothetical protein